MSVLQTGLYQNIFGILFNLTHNSHLILFGIMLVSKMFFPAMLALYGIFVDISSSAVLNICSMLLKVLKLPGGPVNGIN
jgi:hypothetical protein